MHQGLEGLPVYSGVDGLFQLDNDISALESGMRNTLFEFAVELPQKLFHLIRLHSLGKTAFKAHQIAAFCAAEVYQIMKALKSIEGRF